MANEGAQLSELFSSLQGEGKYVGERQVFIRFAGCNLACQYCDTPQALTLTPTFRYEPVAGSHKFEAFNNPAGPEKMIELAAALDKPAGMHHSVCLTGGEPLLQVDFLKAFLPEAKKQLKLPAYLETNGVLPDHLGEVIDLVDIIAMDIKLPGATGQSAYWKEHKKFLEIAYMKELFVKIIFTRETSLLELNEAAALIAGVDDKIPLILQPVTPHGPVKHRPTGEGIFAFQTAARRKLQSVRVIPQVQKLMGIA